MDSVSQSGVHRWTHIKANANTKKQIKEVIPAASKHYALELMAEVNADREAHGKAPLNDDEQPPKSGKKRDNTSKKKQARRKKEKSRTVTRSITDNDIQYKTRYPYYGNAGVDSGGTGLIACVYS